ncbi:MAG: cytochrome ubiquinol oxidase subunit I [Peptococcaceae bacterium]|nr:cytochrome ubiquinol oxidase subunit I [Peptococcaceae bacterium]
MEVVLLSRIQFAVTVAFHFIFPCLSIGLAWLNVIFLAKYRKSKSEDDLRLSYFWVNLFGITFAVGAATGVVMVFQFGSNWADFTHYAASMFVPPLVAEATIAFFLEATFIGILIWGRGKVSKALYFVSSVMVAIGATLSAFIIVAVDSWMQTPAGYIKDAAGNPEMLDGKVQLDNFFEAVFNPSTMPRITHTLIACLITGAGFVLGISAWYLLKKKKQEFAMKSMGVAIVVLLVCSVAQWVVGHWHTLEVVEKQPLKLAAFEGLFESTEEGEGAELLIFGIPDQEKEVTNLKIGIPKMLSFLAYGDFDAPVTGIKDAAAEENVPKEEWPSVLLSFFSYRTMMALGTFFLLFGLWGIFLKARKKLQDSSLFLRIALISAPFGLIAAEVGWMAAEIGRQPWIIQGMMKTSDAISDKVPAEQILVSVLLFVALYLILTLAYVFLVKRKVEEGPDAISLTGSHTEGRIEA